MLVKTFCSWQNDVFVVAEPGELADKFLQSVRFSLLSTVRGRKEMSKLNTISTISELVAYRPYFQIGCVVHRYIGRQTQVCFGFFSAANPCLPKLQTHQVFVIMKVMEDDREIGAYMFRRTVPSMHLLADDVRWMVCIHILLRNLNF